MNGWHASGTSSAPLPISVPSGVSATTWVQFP